MVGGNSQAVNYIALDTSTTKGSTADVWVFRVFAKPVGGDFGGRSPVESFRHISIDCARRSFVELSDDAYDAQDHWVLGTGREPSSRIEASSTQDFLARVMCDGESPPDRVIVRGVAEARDMTRKLLAMDQGSR